MKFRLILISLLSALYSCGVVTDEASNEGIEEERNLLNEIAVDTICDPEFVYLECSGSSEESCREEIYQVADQCFAKFVGVIAPYFDDKSNTDSLRNFSYLQTNCILEGHVGYGLVETDVSMCIDEKLKTEKLELHY